MLGPPFPEVHNHLLSLDHVEGEVVVLAPHGQVNEKHSHMFLLYRWEREVLSVIEIASSVDLFGWYANWSGSSVSEIMEL